MAVVRRLAVIGIGAAFATAFSAPVALVTADASVHAAASCGGEEENGTPVGVVHPSDRYVHPGQEINVWADCFTPGEVVDIAFHSAAVSLGTTEADSQGRASSEVTIPADAECGQHTITMTGEASGFQAVGTVFVCVTVPIYNSGGGGGPKASGHHRAPGGVIVNGGGGSGPPVTAPGTLPFTGAPAAPLSLTGTALVACGAMLTAAARRRYLARHALPAYAARHALD